MKVSRQLACKSTRVGQCALGLCSFSRRNLSLLYVHQVSQFRNDLNALRRSFGSAKATAEKRILLQQGPGSSKVKGVTERLMRYVKAARAYSLGREMVGARRKWR